MALDPREKKQVFMFWAAIVCMLISISIRFAEGSDNAFFLFNVAEATFFVIWARMKFFPSKEHEKGVFLSLLTVSGIIAALFILTSVTNFVNIKIGENDWAATYQEFRTSVTPIIASFSGWVKAVASGNFRTVFRADNFQWVIATLGIAAASYSILWRGFRNTAPGEDKHQKAAVIILAIAGIAVVLAYAFDVIPPGTFK